MKYGLILILAVLMPMAFADVGCGKAYVVNFEYDNGIIGYKDKVLKCGYAPDRVIQPEEGYTAEIISVDDKPLYSFKFQIPLKVNVDLSDPLLKRLSGGIIVLNETDFALIFPYYDEAKSIEIYNPRMYAVLTVPLTEEKFVQKSSFWRIWILILALIAASYMIYKHYRNKNAAKNL